MMYQDTIYEALKWALIVFAAGFIGFFGKYLGKIIMTRFHKEPESGARPAATAPSAPPAGEEAKAVKKMEKARLKTQKKLVKKGPEDGGE